MSKMSLHCSMMLSTSTVSQEAPKMGNSSRMGGCVQKDDVLGTTGGVSTLVFEVGPGETLYVVLADLEISTLTLGAGNGVTEA